MNVKILCEFWCNLLLCVKKHAEPIAQADWYMSFIHHQLSVSSSFPSPELVLQSTFFVFVIFHGYTALLQGLIVARIYAHNGL